MSVQDLDWHAEQHGGLWLIDDSSGPTGYRVEQLYNLPCKEARLCPIAIDVRTVVMVEWRPEGSVAGTSARLSYDLFVAQYALVKRTKDREAAEKALKQAKGEEEKERRRLELLQQGMPRQEQMESQSATRFIELGFLDDQDILREAARRGLIGDKVIAVGSMNQVNGDSIGGRSATPMGSEKR